MRAKIWYININGLEEGPFSIEDLKGDLRVTPDTLVRRSGEVTWRRMGDVKELEEVFLDEVKKPKKFKKTEEELPFDDEIVLSNQKDPNFLLIILIMLTIICFYMIYLSKIS